MVLTGKAKTDFEMWLLKEGNEVIKNGTVEYDLYYMCKYMIPESMVYSKIIDWFDSVGLTIEIGIGRTEDFIGFDFTIWKDFYKSFISDSIVFPSRHEATKQAILKANDIYNETNKTTTIATQR